MKYLPGIVAVMIVMAVADAFSALNRPAEPVSAVTPVTEEARRREVARVKAFEPQISDEGGVIVTVTPEGLSRQARSWVFTVSLQTHSVELSEDMAAVSALVADGEERRPLLWRGSEPGGHHRDGELIFAAGEPLPDIVELKIRSVGDVPERSFRWVVPEG